MSILRLIIITIIISLLQVHSLAAQQHIRDTAAKTVSALTNGAAAKPSIFKVIASMPGISTVGRNVKKDTLVRLAKINGGKQKRQSLAANIAPAISYTTPQIYTPNITITPLVPNNSGGAVPATLYGQVSTFAGSGQQGSVDGTGTQASFFFPTGITADAAGNLYVSAGGLIRKITPAGVVTTFAGNLAGGYINGVGTAAAFNGPAGLAIDNAGNIIVADEYNNVIRKITPAAVVTTVAGTGIAGKGNGNAATATFNTPEGVAVDPAGNIYVTDSNDIIRKIDVTGLVTTFAGSGTLDTLNGAGVVACFRQPNGLCSDKAGNIYVADVFNDMIRKITPGGLVSTFAGYYWINWIDGTGSAARFYYPTGVFTDPYDNIYVTDSFNHRIRMITPGQVVTTVAGNGLEGKTNGPGPDASFNYPLSSAFSQGNLYVTDSPNNLIRKITLTGYTIDKALPPGLVFDPKTGIISGTPLSPFPTTSYTVTGHNAGGSSSASISITVLAAGTLLPSVITFIIVPGNIVLDANNNFNPGATSTNSESPITYTSSNPAVATITPDGLVHVVGVGVSTITASQAGSTHYAAADPVEQILSVYEQEIIDLPPFPVKYVGDADFDPQAVSDVSNYPITYTSSNPAVATIVNGLVHIVGPGTTQITAAQAGDNWYLQATPVTQVLDVELGIVFNALPVATTCTADFDPGATGNGPVVYTSSNTTVAVIVAGKVHITGSGTSTITASNGKVSLTQVLTVNAVIQPLVTITSSIQGAVCPGSAVTFTASANITANASYQWLLNGSKVGPDNAVYTAANFNNNDAVSCIVTNIATNCAVAPSGVSNKITININQPVTPAIVINPVGPVCQGSPLTFTATTTNAGSAPGYQWQVNGQDKGSNSPGFTAYLNNGDIVTVTLTSNTACTIPVTSAGLTVKVNPLPQVSFNSDPIIERGNGTVLSPVVTGDVTTYTWTPSTGLSNAAIANPTASPLTTTTYQLQVTSSSGCEGTGTVTVTVQGIVSAPNTFTPNGDGVNDLWNIPALQAYPNCSVMIYTRYGGLVFKSVGYAKSWDGTYNNQPLPVGVYYYVIDTKDGKPATAGYVTVLR